MPLRKVCRRPETDYRLQQLHAVNDAAGFIEQQKISMDPSAVNVPRASTPTETMQKQRYVDAALVAPVSNANISVATAHTVAPESKQAEVSNSNMAGNSIVPPGAASASSNAAGGSI